MKKLDFAQDDIIALATPAGVGAIAILRLSGQHCIQIVNQVFKGKNLEKQASHTIHFGTICDNDLVLDEVLVSVFVAPNSFTKENSVEISCHASPYIIQQITQLFIKKGVRLAKAGEFTKRAFLNGRFDLAQAEAVADLIAADSELAHRTALNQMRGGFSLKIKHLREKLIHFASMIELELDFGEEDVEFADRKLLTSLVNELQSIIKHLIQSFAVGNVIKNGVPTVIAGKPNAGKSTLLNALLNEEKAIVSEIAGTTRDVIEDELVIEGITFRFIDTAGLRQTNDPIEKIGVQRTEQKMKQASIILYLFDVNDNFTEELSKIKIDLDAQNIPFLMIGNKIDRLENQELIKNKILDLGFSENQIVFISAEKKLYLENLQNALLRMVNLDSFKNENTIVTNIRHYESLLHTQESLFDVLNGISSGITGDLLALDIRNALYHLGEITGEITNDDLLANIFSKFCIGK